ncbi:hypothetical protein HAX54_032813 [Datura stramonium]|uniref:Uncharacterized protein n=1 Tax=Datura stramonium TaxID=4076 RepID=A0ABS8SCU7_DATST|nr:hypothetical protein [Datura stramonium]
MAFADKVQPPAGLNPSSYQPTYATFKCGKKLYMIDFLRIARRVLKGALIVFADLILKQIKKAMGESSQCTNKAANEVFMMVHNLCKRKGQVQLGMSRSMDAFGEGNDVAHDPKSVKKVTIAGINSQHTQLVDSNISASTNKKLLRGDTSVDGGKNLMHTCGDIVSSTQSTVLASSQVNDVPKFQYLLMINWEYR